MNSLYNEQDVEGIINRVQSLTPDSHRHWGRMDVAQMLAHCNTSMETALGMNTIKQVLIGKLIGGFFKKGVLSEKPFGRNSPTDKSYIFKGDVPFEPEKERLVAAIRKFYEGGPAHCTTDAHPFFGKFTPDEWAVFQWKHMDHHLRQFGV